MSRWAYTFLTGSNRPHTGPPFPENVLTSADGCEPLSTPLLPDPNNPVWDCPHGFRRDLAVDDD